MKNIILSFIIIIAMISGGCDKVSQTVDKFQPQNPIDAQVIAESAEGVDTQDLKLMYKQFSGLVLYLNNCSGCITDTGQIETTVFTFQDKYGYSQKNTKFTETVRDYLSKKGYEDVKLIVSDSGQIDETTQVKLSKVVDDLTSIADGIRLALESKENGTK